MSEINYFYGKVIGFVETNHFAEEISKKFHGAMAVLPFPYKTLGFFSVLSRVEPNYEYWMRGQITFN